MDSQQGPERASELDRLIPYTPSKKRAPSDSPVMLNVDIPSNRDKFIAHFMKEVQKYIEQSRGQDEEECKPLQAEQVVHLIREEYLLSTPVPANYYYKRWIWLQFPWMCLSPRVDFSSIMRQCYSNPTDYMSVSEENEYTRKALAIVLEAKVKKEKMLKKGDDSIRVSEKSTVRLRPLLTQKRVPGSYLSHRQLLDEIKLEESEIRSRRLRDGSSPEQSAELSQIMSSARAPYLFMTDIQSEAEKPGSLPKLRKDMARSIDLEFKQEYMRKDKLRKFYDDLCCDNRKLAKKVKELKTIELNRRAGTTGVCGSESIKADIKAKKKRIEQSRYQYAYYHLQIERLKILLQVCGINNTAN
jgi:hypothetical protein